MPERPHLARARARGRRGRAAARSRSPSASACASLLPPVETERRLDDWGRSERVERIFDATLVEFFYRYWFRCEVEGVENVPVRGRRAARLQPLRGAAAGRGDDRQGDPRRAPEPAAAVHDRRALLQGLPGLLAAAAEDRLRPRPSRERAPAALRRAPARARLPRGSQGDREAGQGPLPGPALRPRRLRRGGDARQGASSQPVCVVGAEEAAPIFAQSKLLQRLTGLLYFPITPTFPWLGPVGMLGYLPAKFKIRFLEPIDTTRMGSDPAEDKALVQSVAQEVRARIQENLHEMLEEARSRCGSDEPRAATEPSLVPRRRVLITGLSSYWGGRLAQALEAFAEIEAIVGVDSRDPTRELERTEFVKVSNQHALIQRIVRAARIDTVIDTRLVVDSITAPRREAHENNVIGTMNVLAACCRRRLAGAEVHLQVLGPRLRLRAGRPGLLHRGDEPLAAPRDRRSSATSSRPRPRWSTSPTSRPRCDVTVLRCTNVLGPDVRTASRASSRLPLVPMIARLRPAGAVRPRGRRRPRARARRDPPGPRRLQRRRRRRARALRGDRPARQAARRRCCRRGGPV